MTVAYFTFRRYYPRLKSAFCDTPYPTPTDTGSLNRKHDEEQGIGNETGNGRYSLDDLSEDGERVPLREGS